MANGVRGPPGVNAVKHADQGFKKGNENVITPNLGMGDHRVQEARERLGSAMTNRVQWVSGQDMVRILFLDSHFLFFPLLLSQSKLNNICGPDLYY